MGIGRTLGRAIKSKISPRTFRWCPRPNARARCMGTKLIGHDGGGRAGVRTRFVEASGACKLKGS